MSGCNILRIRRKFILCAEKENKTHWWKFGEEVNQKQATIYFWYEMKDWNGDLRNELPMTRDVGHKLSDIITGDLYVNVIPRVNNVVASPSPWLPLGCKPFFLATSVDAGCARSIGRCLFRLNIL